MSHPQLADYEPFLQAQDLVQLHSLLRRASADLGFHLFGATAFQYRSDGTYVSGAINNVPETYVEMYEDNDVAAQDPVSSHCRDSHLPIVWDRSTYAAAGQGERHEFMAAQGLNSGIATALHLPGGKHFLLGLDPADAMPGNSSDVAHLVAQVQLLAVYSHEAVARLTLNPPQLQITIHLTPREVEVLKWSMDGKTAWETGNILNISERTTTMHIANSMRKLGVSKRGQAVLKAYQLGLLK